MSSHYKPDETTVLANVRYNQETDSITVKPQALNIIWAGDARYWKIPLRDGPAELLQVSWLEVSGKVSTDKLKGNKNYAVRFRLELKGDNFGWGGGPVYFMARVGEEKRQWKKLDLSAHNPGDIFDAPAKHSLIVHLPHSGDRSTLHFGMYEIWRGRWKGGLLIHEVIVEPAD